MQPLRHQVVGATRQGWRPGRAGGHGAGFRGADAGGVMTADTRIRQLTAAAVLLVAVIAAVVSFIHIEHLAVTHGQPQLAAWLLPVSVDGTVRAARLSGKTRISAGSCPAAHAVR